MALSIIPILHIVATILSIIELGLTAYWANLFHGYWSPSTVNFMVFNSVWSLLVLIYIGLASAFIPSIFNRTVALALNLLTQLFWFAGSIALAVWYGGPYDCNGGTACSNAEAAIAFGFFSWAIFAFLALVDALEFLRRRGHDVKTSKSTNAYPGA
ncbi:membrane-associating domain-containing protein [Xylaria nigripes]|nr:membrane-associating domain-containing protein [Xylaria nigripes]